MTSQAPRPPRPHGIVLAAKDTLPPPDPGLQSERTSLSWVRLFTATAIALAVMAKLTLMLSPWVTAAYAILIVIPMGGLALFEQGHVARIRWFEHTEHSVSGAPATGQRDGPVAGQRDGQRAGQRAGQRDDHTRYRWAPLAAMTALCVVLSLLALALMVALYVG